MDSRWRDGRREEGAVEEAFEVVVGWAVGGVDDFEAVFARVGDHVRRAASAGEGDEDVAGRSHELVADARHPVLGIVGRMDLHRQVVVGGPAVGEGAAGGAAVDDDGVGAMGDDGRQDVLRSQTALVKLRRRRR